MALSGSGAKKILILFTAAQGAVILLLAGAFTVLTAENSSVMRDIVTGYSASVAADKTRAGAAASFTGKDMQSKEFMERLFAYCRNDPKILSAILFSKTADENFFKVSARIDLGARITIPVEIGQRVKEGTEDNWLKKGLYSETTDRTLFSNKEKNLYWHNAYIPVRCKDGQFVLRVMVSASDAVMALNDYAQKVSRIRLILIILTGILLAASITASALFLRNFNLFIAGLTGYVKQAAGGDTSLSLRGDIDEDLSELALSFNTLVGELKEKDRVIGELRERTTEIITVQNAPQPEQSDTGGTNVQIEQLQLKLAQAQAERDKMLAEQNRSDELSETFRRGVDLLKQEKYEDAAAIFTSLTILKPDGFGGFFNLGVALAKMRQFDRALDMFYKALSINPNHAHTEIYIEKVRRLRENYERR